MVRDVRLGDRAWATAAVGMPQAARPRARRPRRATAARAPGTAHRSSSEARGASSPGRCRLEGELDDEAGASAPGRARSTPDRRAVGRARPPATVRARCPRPRPGARPGHPGRSARRGGPARTSATPGPWSSTTTRMAVAGKRRPGDTAGWRSTRTRLTPPAYWVAFSTRLAITRSNRRLSTRRRRPSTPGTDVHGEGDRSAHAVLVDRCGGGHGPADQLAGVDLVEGQLGRPGVEPGDLEQVVDHPGEAPEVAVEEVERTLCPRGELVAVALDHRDGGGQGGEGRPQLVAHVGGEPGLPLDAVLEVGGHPVERRGQLLEIGVVAGIDAGVELAVGDGHRGVGQARRAVAAPGSWPSDPRRRPPAWSPGPRRRGRRPVPGGCRPARRGRRPRSRRPGRPGAARR